MSVRNHPHLIDIEIVNYSKKGHGIGFYNRQDETRWPVEVPFAIPGDIVRVQLFRKRSGIYQSKLIETLSPSKERIIPRCIHFGICGGCRWQQISYEHQLRLKEDIVRKCFTPVLGETTIVHPIVPSVKEWHYRNKMEYSFSSDIKGSRFSGLIINGSKGKVFQLTECHLPNSWFVQALNAARDWWDECKLDAYHAASNKGSLRTLTLREGQKTGDRMVNLTVSGNPDYALHRQQLDRWIEKMRHAVEPVDSKSKLSLFLTVHQIAKGQPTQLFELHLYGPDSIRETLEIQPNINEEPVSLKFHISPKAFFQPNTYQAEILYSKALQLAAIPKKSVVYDLYCGTGTLGICAARHAAKVVGIELSPDSAHDARHNASANGFDHVTILTGSVEKKLEELQKEKLLPLPDLVMIDPPRAGLDHRAIEHITALNPQKILYISCNPATQADNISSFIEKGYQLMTVQPVDQFPQTVHIENIALLSRKP